MSCERGASEIQQLEIGHGIYNLGLFLRNLVFRAQGLGLGFRAL